MKSKRPKKSVITQCAVCGNSAIYSYFGAIVCQSCRVFFRRNSQKRRDVLKCVFDGDCEVNTKNRHVCAYCRLMKCFRSGMQIELIRSSRSKSHRRKSMPESTSSTAVIQSNQFEQFPKMNLRQSNPSVLTIDQWNLISNLSDCYDEHSGLLKCQRFVRGQNALPAKLRFKTTAMIQSVQILMSDSRIFYQNNRDFLSLSAQDRSILLLNTFAYVGSRSTNFILNTVRLMNYPMYCEAVERITNSDVIPAAKLVEELLNFDAITMKLFLVISSFSTIRWTTYDSPTLLINLSDIKQILSIQGQYIEVLWRYLLYRYDFAWTVKCLSNFLRCIFAIHDGILMAQGAQWLRKTY